MVNINPCTEKGSRMATRMTEMREWFLGVVGSGYHTLKRTLTNSVCPKDVTRVLNGWKTMDTQEQIEGAGSIFLEKLCLRMMYLTSLSTSSASSR